TGIDHIDENARVNIPSKESDIRVRAARCRRMADSNISIDFINMSPPKVVYTVSNDVAKKAVQLLEEKGFKVTVVEHCAKVSAVGAGMTGIPGVAAKITTALTKNDVKVLQSADSHTTIWVLVENNQLKLAINALHEAFELNKTSAYI